LRRGGGKFLFVSWISFWLGCIFFSGYDGFEVEGLGERCRTGYRFIGAVLVIGAKEGCTEKEMNMSVVVVANVRVLVLATGKERNGVWVNYLFSFSFLDKPCFHFFRVQPSGNGQFRQSITIGCRTTKIFERLFQDHFLLL
jgi:hypothetical protein